MPAAAEYLRPELIAQVRRLDLRARFIVEGFYSGLHRSPFHGFSVEFSEHRRYVPGDDPRGIDWNLYARTDRYFVKQYQAETSLEAHLVLDVSASMGFPAAGDRAPARSRRDEGGPHPALSMSAADTRLPQRMSKHEYVVCLAAALGYMMIRQQDAVGLALVGETLRAGLPARSRRAHLMQVLSTLAATQPAGPTGLAAGLRDLARRIRRRGLIIVFSDLLCEPAPVLEALRMLRLWGHDLIVFCVLDEAEVSFPFHGPTRFEDPEGGVLEADADGLREAYAAALRDLLDRYRRGLAEVRADFVRVHTAMPFDAALTRFLIERRGRM